MAKSIAVIFAGGSGARMGSGIPKQFTQIEGKPIIIHTLENFEDHDEIDEIYISCKEDYIAKLDKLTKRYLITKVVKIVAGGATGQDSIYNALVAAADRGSSDDIVLIHDGVRPHITARLISDNIASVREHGSGITCTSMLETPILSDSETHVEDTIARERIFTAQAPQSFYLGEILEAHNTVREQNPDYAGIVDSCTLMKSLGKEIFIVNGHRGNIKVTTPEDLYLLKGLIEYKEVRQAFGMTENEIPQALKKQ